MSRGALRLLGTLLIAYGVVGIALLAVLTTTIASPLDEIGRLAESVGEQRSAALRALEEATVAAEQTATAMGNVDASLLQASTAVGRAAGLSQGVAASMRELARAMTIDVFGVQPLIGLAAGFETSAANLELLAGDLRAIGAALDSSRRDTVAVAASVEGLVLALDDLRVTVAASPDMSASVGARESLRLGLLALMGWLIAGAMLAVVAGAGCWWAARRATHVVEPLDRVQPLD